MLRSRIPKSGLAFPYGIGGAAAKAGQLIWTGATGNRTVGGFAMSYWIRTRHHVAETMLLRKMSSSNPGWLTGLSAGCPRFYLRQNGMKAPATATATVTDGAWHHLAFSCDVVGTTRVCRVYIDGVIAASSATPWADLTTSLSHTEQMRIGTTSTVAQNFVGDVADIRIYSNSLTAAQILAQYTNQVWYERKIDIPQSEIDAQVALGCDGWWPTLEGNDNLLAYNAAGYTWPVIGGSEAQLANVAHRYWPVDRLRRDATRCGRIWVSTDLHYTAANDRVALAYFPSKVWAYALGYDKAVCNGDNTTGTSAEQDAVDVPVLSAQLATSGDTYASIGGHDTRFLGLTGESGVLAIYAADGIVGEVGGAPSPYYSFDIGDPARLHCVVMFGGEAPIGNAEPLVSQEQLDWLAADLAATDVPTVVFMHYRLDQTWPMPDYVWDTHDGSQQLGCWKLNGATADNSASYYRWYWTLEDAAGTRTVKLYKNADKAAGNLVAQGSRVGDGFLTLAQANGSGLSGSVYVTYSADDTDAENIVTLGIWMSPGKAGGATVQNAAAVRAVLEASGVVKWVVSGHEHSQRWGVVNGIKYIVVRTAGCDETTTPKLSEIGVASSQRLEFWSDGTVSSIGSGLATTHAQR
jgi:hypothetical protein